MESYGATPMIYIFKDGEQKGPFEVDVLQACLKGGVFVDSDLAWKEGLADWIPLSEFVPLHISGSPPPKITPPPLPQPQQTAQAAPPELSGISEFYSVGECYVIPGGNGRMTGRNLNIIDPTTNTIVFSFIEKGTSLGAFIARKVFVSSGEHSSFNSDVLYMEKPIGTIKGQLSCKLYDLNAKICSWITQKHIFNSFALLARYSIPIIALVVVTIFLISFLHQKAVTKDFASVDKLTFMGVGLIYALYARWLFTRRKTFVFNEKHSLVCEIKPHKALFSPRSFELVNNKRTIGKLSKPVSDDEANKILGRTTGPTPLGIESQKLTSKYNADAVKSMPLGDKIKFARDVIAAANRDTKSEMASMPPIKKTTLRVMSFSEALRREDLLAVFAFTYFVHISNDCDDM
ncbi:MAG: DUF4339 domain-containing protein [Verrucomicrobiae bacterium]